MAVELIVVPYVLGREGAGMGAGPLALARGATDALAPDRIERIGLSAPFGNEIGACFDLVAGLGADDLALYDPAFDPDGTVRNAALAVLLCAS